MKGLIVLVLIGVAVVVGFIWSASRMSADPGRTIALVFGVPDEETIEIHAAVAPGMVAAEGPRMDRNGNVLWDEWIAEHFDLRDEAGDKVPMHRRNFSDLIPANKVVGTPEFYVAAKLRIGGRYTFDYIPLVRVGKRYRHTFTAPEDDTSVKRPNFGPVSEE